MVLTEEGVSFPCMRVEVGARNGLKSFGAMFKVSFWFVGLSVEFLDFVEFFAVVQLSENRLGSLLDLARFRCSHGVFNINSYANIF